MCIETKDTSSSQGPGPSMLPPEEALKEVFKNYLLNKDFDAQIPDDLRKAIQTKAVTIDQLARSVFSKDTEGFRSYMTENFGGRRELKNRLGDCIALKEAKDSWIIRFFRGLCNFFSSIDNEDRLLGKAKALLNEKEFEGVQSPKMNFDDFFTSEIERLNAKKPPDAPIIVVLETDFDDSHAFRQPDEKLDLLELAKTHYIYIQKSGFATGAENALLDALNNALALQDRIGRIEAVICRAHGSSKSMRFSITQTGLYSGNDSKDVAELLTKNRSRFAEKLRRR
jgi:hypothetical protein